jgi:hypothetical protein
VTFEIQVKGASKVEQNAKFLPLDVRQALKKEKKRLAKNLAAKLRRAVIANTKVSRQTSPERSRRGSHASMRPMGSRVRPTIRQAGDRVIAGPHPMLIATEFGMNSKSGWYGRPEFASNPSLQYFRHISEGYWWHPTVERSKPEADAAVRRAVDEAVSRWG